MANSVQPTFPEIWAKKMQMTFKKENQAEKFADTSYSSSLRSGDVLHRQFGNIDPNGAPGVHVRGADIAESFYTASDETMSIDFQFSTRFFVEKFDEIQSDISLAGYYGEQFGAQMKGQIDLTVFGETLNSASVVDAGDLGGTGGQGISLSSSNVINVVAAVRKKFKKLNVSTDNMKGAISPEFVEFLTLYGAQRDTSMGDDVNRRGFFGKFSGVDLYETNNTTGTAVLDMATQPTNGDVITLAGQTFTAVSTIGTTAGNYLIGANVDVTRATLAALINDPATTSSTQVALGTATSEVVKLFAARISAVNDNSANTMTVTHKGAGTIVVTEALTDGTDTWTATAQKQHCLFVAGSGPALVVQQTPNVSIVESEARNGSFAKMTCLFGVNTYSDQAKMMVDVQLNSSTY